MASSLIKSAFDCILFDLDDTLYSSNAGIAQACKRNIEAFLARKCGVSADRAAALRVEMFRSNGSSLIGLMAMGYAVHPDEYHGAVHWTLPYDRIPPDPQLRELLISIPQTKIIFTNSDLRHVRNVLERLGIEEQCFDAIVCFESLNPHLFSGDESGAGDVILKPSFAAVEAAIRVAGTDPRRTLFLDDSERNIAAGKALGLRTAVVGKKTKAKEADYLVESINKLRKIIPSIWGGGAAAAAAADEEEKEDEFDFDHMAVRNELGSMRQAASAVEV